MERRRRRYLIRINGRQFVRYVWQTSQGVKTIETTQYKYDAADCRDATAARKLAKAAGGTPVEFDPITGNVTDLAG